MNTDRVQVQDIVSDQLPGYIQDDFPLLGKFLEQYYLSVENNGGSLNILNNIDQYVKVDNLYDIKTSTGLASTISFVDDTITTELDTNFTYGFPERNGLIKIDNEIIFYGKKTQTTFTDCVRGFSGIVSYTSPNKPDELVFENSFSATHAAGSKIENLSVLFLEEFFNKVKNQFVPGFSGRDLFSGLDQRNFIFGAKSFYDAKGTDRALKILFQALYGDEVNIVKPSEFLIKPSTADYSVTKDFVIEPILGDPFELKNRTIQQLRTGAKGTVTNVQKVIYNNDQYLQISIDIGYQRDIDLDGSIFGTFESIPSTKVLNNVSVGQTTIDVDSTIGFPNSGELISFNVGNEEFDFTYGSKNDNQFLDITGITTNIADTTSVFFDDYASTINDDIRFRISTTLTDLIIDDSTYYFNKDDVAELQSLGIDGNSLPVNNLINNLKFKWRIQNVEEIDISERKYIITTFDDTYLKRGYSLEILRDSEVITEGNVLKNLGSDRFEILLSSIPDSFSGELVARNKILKGNYKNHPEINQSFTNIVNSYQKFNGDTILSSNSFPTYGNNDLIETNDKVIIFSSSNVSGDTFTFSSEHGLYTGDAVYYSPTLERIETFVLNGVQQYEDRVTKFSNIDEGVYFVKRIGRDNSRSFKIARSKSDLFDNKFISPGGTVTNNKFTYQPFYNKKVSPQEIYREVKTPIKNKDGYDTYSGKIGMFNNGVEILNYKSDDIVYFGDIKSIDVVDRGDGFDIINPPVVHISDGVGVGATAKSAVIGRLEEIRISDTGFDYVQDPIVTITGGNPVVPAQVQVETIDLVHGVNFLSESSSGLTTSITIGVGSSAHRIGFSTSHKFYTGEKIIYLTNGGRNISGISTFNHYFVEVVDDKNIRLHSTSSNARIGINTLTITDYGTGLQTIQSFDKKKIVSKCHILNPGEGYKNKERNIAGVTTSTNTIFIEKHGYQTGEKIRYSPSTVNISGIVSNTDYYVQKIDNDRFNLSQIGTGSTINYFLNNNVYVSLGSTGNGTFNYEPISVSINGVLGISTLSGQDFNAKIQPVFRGSIDFIEVINGGSNYGSPEIINFNRTPEIELKSGSGAQVTPIINNGRIVSVIVNDGGKDYNCPPNIKINGNGQFAKLTPIVRDNKLVEIKVINGGVGFDNKSSLTIESPVTAERLDINIHQWTVNLFEKSIDIIGEDDGVICNSFNNESLQYSHLYAPRELRRKLNPISDFEVLYGVDDLELDPVNKSELNSKYHSPIIGWAYDGHPIYGPYGYENSDGGSVKLIESGYKLNITSNNRPSLSFYPEGFFVEDFEFNGNGDLDEHNGRYSVTPDFPFGSYAYFATIESVNSSFGLFNKFKAPKFPYIVGNTFNSQPNTFNYRKSSNQKDFNFAGTGYFRNTNPYNFVSKYSGYDYIFDSNNLKKQSFIIGSASIGGVESIKILSGGDNYQVGDKINFDNKNSGGLGANAKIKNVKGKAVVSAATSSTEIDVEFALEGINESRFIGFSTVPHNLKSGTLVNIGSISKTLPGFGDNYFVGVRTDSFNLNLGVGNTSVTGLTTYFYVTGILDYPTIRPNDILQISAERIKVLNIDSLSGRIRVVREQDGTVGTSYSTLTSIVEDPRKFTFNVGSIKSTTTFNLNEEIYFEPEEAIGVGTAVGTATTITFKNPAIGVTAVTLQSQQIYLPNHKLNLNDIVSYNNFTGTAVSTWNGTTDTYNLLSDYSILYVAPITNNLIGIATNKVGLASTGGGYSGLGTSTGLLFFPGFGTGDFHSFKTVKTDVVTGKIGIHTVTVSTASTHGLENNNKVFFDLKPKSTKTIDVRYNDYNRRVVFDPKTFTSNDVNVVENTIKIINHKFNTGDKIVYNASTVISGLIDQKMYYVVIYGEDKIKLCSEKIDVSNKNFVKFSSANAGTVSRINPYVSVLKNQKLKFDLSDSSLGFINSGVSYSAFDLKIYSDLNYTNEFLTSGEDEIFEVVKTGTIGVSTDASLIIDFNDSFNKSNLWYRFVGDNQEILPAVKSEIVSDVNVFSNNQIDLVNSIFYGLKTISGIGTTTFTFSIPEKPENENYNVNNASISYTTDSKTAYGIIESIQVFNTGSSYELVPGISSITSHMGSGAILEPQSKSIGEILSYTFDTNNIGFGYPSDITLRPVVNLPEILKIEPLSSFDFIGITSSGKNYLKAPKLIVIDGFTQKVIDDVDLQYDIGDTSVSIVKNTTAIYNTKPTLIPTNNTNGVGISSVTYNSTLQIVRLHFNTTFSDASDYPFAVGKKILVENINLGFNTTGRGYNSSDFNFALFEVTNSVPQLGGPGGYIEYSLENYLSITENPGVALLPSLGRVIPEDHFPLFDVKFSPNEFSKGEMCTSGGVEGKVLSWNSNIEILKISTSNEIKVGDLIQGNSSKTQGIVSRKINFNAESKTGAGATVYNGWKDDVGFLNDSFQKIPNNEYYQNFSYAVKSKIPFDTWNPAVNALNHTAGFVKFGDLQIVSILDDVTQNILQTSDSNVETIVDIQTLVDLNCVYNFDYVRETHEFINGGLYSNEILFESSILSDYFESVGNRVLSIDDFSSSFNSNERPDSFSSIGDFTSNMKYNKIFAYVKDRTFTDERQFSILSLAQDDNFGYLDEYAILDSKLDLGHYSYRVTSSGWDLTFNPNKFEVNNYDTSIINIAAIDDYTGVGSITAVGTAVSTSSQQNTVSVGTTTNIVSIATSYRSGKVLLMLEDSNDNYLGNELTFLHDGTTVHLLEYGGIGDNSNATFTGFGTYNSYLSGNNVKIDFIPDANTTALTANAQITAISASETGIGTVALDVGRFRSTYKSISSSSTPGFTTVATLSEPYDSGYYFINVTDSTNNVYESFELGVLRQGLETSAEFVEYANVSTGSTIGEVNISENGTDLSITYKAKPSINVQVRTYAIDLQTYDDNTNTTQIDYFNWKVNSDNGSYRGTKLDITKDFNLLHEGKQIFRRVIDGSNPSIANTSLDLIKIPEHFFVTGEELVYSNSGAGTSQSIGITSATVPGIGLTDKLPTKLFAVKVDDGSLRFAATAEKSLLINPETFDFTNVGYGDSHVFTAKNQNTKTLLTIDNMIQSPVVGSSVTTALASSIIFDTRFTTIGITSFFAGDLVQINDEIMKVTDIGVGNDNAIGVLREQLGTTLVQHGIGSTITKLIGNFNIAGNIISFAAAPFGNVPIGSITNPPDSRDFSGITTRSSFHGRTFMRNVAQKTSAETYSTNYIFDDISTQFTGIKSDFILKSQSSNVTGISTGNGIVLINGIFQLPRGEQPELNNYTIIEDAGISTITFSGLIQPEGYDPSKGNLPTGGVIVSVGNTAGFAYQPLVSAGGTGIISGLGTISSVSIGNSGSGYRSGIQTTVNVSVALSEGYPPIQTLGTANISNGNIVSVAITNPGTGFTTSDPPLILFDSPLSYENIPLEYHSSSLAGVGRSATVDIVVGQGSSVIDFKINSYGYAYGNNEILTIPTGGTTGIPTNTSLTFEDFTLTIQDVYTDNFNGWSLGQFQIFDSFASEFNGEERSFRLTVNEEAISIVSAKGSLIDVEQTLIIFINDVLQKPGSAFSFNGGSIVEFAEAPKVGDTVKVIYYKGTGDDIDVVFRDVLQTVKPGDSLDINYNPRSGQSYFLDQEERIVTGINTVDSVQTTLYNGPGITSDTLLQRPVTWCKQTKDLVINSKKIGKDREIYEPLSRPSSYLITSVGVGSTECYVNNLVPAFNPKNEIGNASVRNKHQKIIEINDQKTLTGAAATAVVGTAGTIISFSITNPGAGYTVAPSVFVSNPAGFGGTTGRAEATSLISAAGTVTSVTVSYGGTTTGLAYTSTNPPSVLIESPPLIREKINITEYKGDYGVIVGILTAKSGSQNTIQFDTYIPRYSFMRDTNVGSGVTVSGISTGDYFVLNGTSLSVGSTFAAQDSSGGTTVGVGTTALDCVYQVKSFIDRNITVYVEDTSGVTTSVRTLTVNVDRIPVGIGSTSGHEIGNYSWGKITFDDRTKPKSFPAHTLSGIGSAYSDTGISTSSLVRRLNPLKFKAYSV